MLTVVTLCRAGANPDLSDLDESEGLGAEFALLEEELAADQVESASLRRQSIFWSPSAVTVFTREDIRASGASDIADLLRRVPGFDVYELKPSYALVGARALTDESNNLLLLQVDGREALAEITGFAFWNTLVFDLEEIERVEVIRGPGSALYGANAFAAVVSITTIPEKPADRGEVFMTAGEQGRARLYGRVNQQFDLDEGVLDFGLGFGHEKAFSPSDIRDSIIDTFRMKSFIRYHESESMDLSLVAGSIFGEGVIYIHMGDMRFNPGHNYFFIGNSEFNLGENTRLKARFYHTRYYGVFKYRARMRAYDIWIADVPDITLGVRTFDGRVQFDWLLSDDLMFICGTNLRYNTIDWKNAIVDDKDEIRGAAFLHAQWSPWSSVQLTAGFRLDVNAAVKETVFSPSPRAVVVFRPWRDHSFRLGYGLAFRRPSYFENRIHAELIDYNQATPEVVELGATQIGNEDLVNEKVHTFEAGWRAHLLDDSLRMSADLFYSLYYNTITFTVDIPTSPLGLPDMANSILRYENEGTEVDALGGEFEVRWQPADEWMFWGNLGLRHVTSRETGKRMPNEPRLRTNLGARYLPGSGLFADVALHYVSSYRMPLVDPVNPLDNREWIPLGQRFLTITRLGCRLGSDQGATLEVGLALQAPLGRPYREYAGTPVRQGYRVDTATDFGGEMISRIWSAYLRGAY